MLPDRIVGNHCIPANSGGNPCPRPPGNKRKFPIFRFPFNNASIQRFQGLGQFIFANRPGDVMSNHASKTVSLHRRHFSQQVLDQCSPNRCKGVAIVETERRELVALAAKVESFPQSKFTAARFSPKFFGGFVTVGSRFVQSFLFLTQSSVDCDHGFPRPILQPLPFYLDLAGRRRRFNLMRRGVDMPSL